MKPNTQQVFIVDDDEAIRDAMKMLLEVIDLSTRCFSAAAECLAFFDGSQRGCLVLDIRMPGISGLELQTTLSAMNATIPIIFITGHGDIPMAVEAMRKGALDFMRKPIREQDFIDRVQQALTQEKKINSRQVDMAHIRQLIATLTPKEYDIFSFVADGKANKVIALNLGVSERTVEVHRAQVMKKLQVRTLAQLVRMKINSEGVMPMS